MLMETKNEKDLRVYVRPETEVVEMNYEGVICASETLEPGTGGGGI